MATTPSAPPTRKAGRSSIRRLAAVVALLLIAGGLGFVDALPASAATTTFDAPTTIPSAATCTSTQPDATAALQSWINSLPSSSSSPAIARLGAVCYRTEGPIYLKSKQSFTLDGNGAMLQAFTDGCVSQDPSPGAVTHESPWDFCSIAPPSGSLIGTYYTSAWPIRRSRISVLNSTATTVKNIRLDGGNAQGQPATYFFGGNCPANMIGPCTLEGQHALDLRDNTGVTVDSVTADRVWGDFVYVSASNQATVIHNHFGQGTPGTTGSGRQGLTIVAGTGVAFWDNDMAQASRSMVDVEPNSATAVIADVSIVGNRFGHSNFVTFNLSGAYATVTNLAFQANTLIGQTLDFRVGVPGGSPATPVLGTPNSFKRHTFKVIGNTSTTGDSNPTLATVQVSWVAGLEVRDNNAKVNSTADRPMKLLKTQLSQDVTVTGNHTTNAVETAFYCNSANLTETGNFIGAAGNVADTTPPVSQPC
jgi:hypothetical protein